MPRWQTLAAGALGAAADLVAPLVCAACHTWIPSGAGHLCSPCQTGLDRLVRLPHCTRCGRAARRESILEHGCAACDSESHWNVGNVSALGPYHEPLATIVRELKYRGDTRCAAILAGRMAERLRPEPWLATVDALVPVPMHWLRRLQRPCAHAAVLADALAKALRLPLLPLVTRVRYAPSQTHIPIRTRRFSNVADCFALAHPDAVRRVPRRDARSRGPVLCIVDNLLMSGATVHEVSRVLRAGGAGRVHLAVAARTRSDGDAAVAGLLAAEAHGTASASSSGCAPADQPDERFMR
ncbi:MAG: ComF family protein [Planctomycetia bacterium]|nr:MAG: ComF family protein [Planctomycetia bacterium]